MIPCKPRAPHRAAAGPEGVRLNAQPRTYGVCCYELSEATQASGVHLVRARAQRGQAAEAADQDAGATRQQVLGHRAQTHFGDLLHEVGHVKLRVWVLK